MPGTWDKVITDETPYKELHARGKALPVLDKETMERAGWAVHADGYRDFDPLPEFSEQHQRGYWLDTDPNSDGHMLVRFRPERKLNWYMAQISDEKVRSTEWAELVMLVRNGREENKANEELQPEIYMSANRGSDTTYLRIEDTPAISQLLKILFFAPSEPTPPDHTFLPYVAN